MSTVTVAEAQADFPRFVQRIRDGEVLVLEENGVALGRVEPVRGTERAIDPSERIGFLVGQGRVPLNWKELGREEIEKEFYGE